MPRTKIVCTIGPASSSPQTLERLIGAGMNVARLNFSHGTHEGHGEAIASIRGIADWLGVPVAIMQDLSGTKNRIGQIAEGAISVESGALLTLTARDVPGDQGEISIGYPDLVNDVHPGDPLLLNDGAVELEVLETSGEDIKCLVKIGGQLSSHKGINLPTRSIGVPGLTNKDRRDLAFGIQHQVDYVALSFVRSASDVLEGKRFMEERGIHIPLIGKIEKHEALNNIDEIIEAVDGIMVARGDLGVDMPLEKVPLAQKMLIGKSNAAGKPVITATQMLSSMVQAPRPTRAEAADVANAVLDGTDALMLSEETAVGDYPVESVAIMARIATDAESGLSQSTGAARRGIKGVKELPEAVGRAACDLADEVDAACIVTFTQSGSTASLVAKCRPRQPILALTPLESTYRRLSMVWGVVPVLGGGMDNTDEMIANALSEALRSGLAKRGQRVVVTAGVPVGVSGTTNLIKVEVL